jgi:hypothetical protein
MLVSDLITALKDLATLIGLPFFTVLMGFFILAVELFVLGVFVLFALWRVRKEMINLNRKIDLLAPPLEKGSEIESAKEPKNEIKKESGKESERELEKKPEKEPEKKKYRYKWK